MLHLAPEIDETVVHDLVVSLRQLDDRLPGVAAAVEAAGARVEAALAELRADVADIRAALGIHRGPPN